jgi:tRNA-splicing ligase RtcB (3'-phosphate/5'-hydroxy nucleic acid ligase)
MSDMSPYELRQPEGGVPIKSWTRGVPIEAQAIEQLSNIARLPIVHRWVAAMPDVHLGIGATVGSVIPTISAIIPAAVGVDIGCGMMALQTTLKASDLPDSLGPLRGAIERAVPHGRGRHGGKGDHGSWNALPAAVSAAWSELEPGFKRIASKHPAIEKSNQAVHLGTLGTGNHFIEVCLDEADRVWFLLHSGSRGVGNRIGSHFIELAKRDMTRHIQNLPDANLAYFEEGSEHFDDYVEAVSWAPSFARRNREMMMDTVVAAVRRHKGIPPFQIEAQAVNCHHNYVQRERHYAKDVYVTRKGAVRAGLGETRHHSRQHGRAFVHRAWPRQSGELRELQPWRGSRDVADRGQATLQRRRSQARDRRRRMPQGRARDRRNSDGYKDIDAVMEAQRDLVEIVHTLKQVVCVKG